MVSHYLGLTYNLVRNDSPGMLKQLQQKVELRKASGLDSWIAVPTSTFQLYLGPCHFTSGFCLKGALFYSLFFSLFCFSLLLPLSLPPVLPSFLQLLLPITEPIYSQIYSQFVLPKAVTHPTINTSKPCLTSMIESHGRNP